MSQSSQSVLTQAEIIGDGDQNRIAEIIVYTNQAYVKRQVHAKARPGLNRILVETAPKPSVSDYRAQQGVMLWDIDLKPKAVKDIRIKFYVKHPKNNPPWGL